jgi:hypothetical protein
MRSVTNGQTGREKNDLELRQRDISGNLSVDLDFRLPHAFSLDWLCGECLLVSVWEIVLFATITFTTGVLGFRVYIQNPALAKILFVISALSLLFTILETAEFVS